MLRRFCLYNYSKRKILERNSRSFFLPSFYRGCTRIVSETDWLASDERAKNRSRSRTVFPVPLPPPLLPQSYIDELHSLGFINQFEVDSFEYSGITEERSFDRHTVFLKRTRTASRVRSELFCRENVKKSVLRIGRARALCSRASSCTTILCAGCENNAKISPPGLILRSPRVKHWRARGSAV